MFKNGFFFDWGTDKVVIKVAKKELERLGGKWINDYTYFSKDGPIGVTFYFTTKGKFKGVFISISDEISVAVAEGVIIGTLESLFGPPDPIKPIIEQILKRDDLCENEKQFMIKEVKRKFPYNFLWKIGQTKITVNPSKQLLQIEFKEEY